MESVADLDWKEVGPRLTHETAYVTSIETDEGAVLGHYMYAACRAPVDVARRVVAGIEVACILAAAAAAASSYTAVDTSLEC